MTCTFFGHSETGENIKPILKQTLIELIETRGVDRFLVGDNGRFDAYVYDVLVELKDEYPHIDYVVMLAHIPKSERSKKLWLDYSKTVFDDELIKTPPRYAILKRNDIMIKRSDIVVCHITHISNGAYEAVYKAEKKGLEIIRI